MLLAAQGCLLAAQQVLTEFHCDFETPADDAQWVLNPGPRAGNIGHKWCIGEAANTTPNGKRSLYVTTDNGATAGYSSSPSCVVAYVPLALNPGHDYALSFDWRAYGDGSEKEHDYLYVAWIPERDLLFDTEIELNTLEGAQLSSVLTGQNTIRLDDEDDKKMWGTSYWQHCTATLRATAVPRRLVFVWITYGNPIHNPGACIDNIEILDPVSCPAPKGLRMQASEEVEMVELSWNSVGDAAQYEVQYHSYTSDTWRSELTTDTVVPLYRIPEGWTTFRVRAVCDELHTGPFAVINQLVYYKANFCIDYLNLDDTICYTAQTVTTDVDDRNSLDYRANIWQLGTVSTERHNIMEGQHVVYTDSLEYDELVPQLRTVPSGAIASVRLGNAGLSGSSIGDAAQMRIPYKVDIKSNPVMILRYAMVLNEIENETPHTRVQVPRFMLRVVDKDRQLLDNCMYADYNTIELRTDPRRRETNTKIGKVYWYDWTAVGFVLPDEYDGQEVTVEVSVFDCTLGGHFGYVYFTLECASSQIGNAGCGQVSTVFTAPAGFLYRWFDTGDPERKTLSTDRTYEVRPDDPSVYAVELSFEHRPECTFTLIANTAPYLPSADASADYAPADCSNTYRFTDRSHIKLVNQFTREVTHTEAQVDYVQWDFGDGSPAVLTRNPEHTYPREGGSFDVHLTAVLEECTADTVFRLQVPDIRIKPDTSYVVACRADGYLHNDSLYRESVVIRDTLPGRFGCDSIRLTDLTIADSANTWLSASITDDHPYAFLTENGVLQLNVPGDYTARLLTRQGCDSIVHLHLDVHEVLRVALGENAFLVCADNPVFTVPYVITNGSTDTYSLSFSPSTGTDVSRAELPADGILVELPKEVKPGNYTLTLAFHDDISGDVLLPVSLEIDYASSIIVQKWNDVLALRNASANGGYTFTAWQWLRNGQPIEGATGEYLYLPDGTLDTDASYSVLLTRPDGVTVAACPYVPTVHTDIFDFPSLADAAQYAPARFPQAGSATFWSVSGNAGAPVAVGKGSCQLLVPGVPGLYLLRFTGSDGRTTVRKVLVR